MTTAPNGLVYSTAGYLDAMADRWDALVLNDYEAVMALPSRIKWGIRYIYQPAFIQQLGIISNVVISKELQDSFIQELSGRYRLIEVTLNHANHFSSAVSAADIKSRKNYVLDLKRDYEAIQKEYDPAFSKSIRRISKFQLSYHRSNDYKKAIQSYEELYSSTLKFFTAADYQRFIHFCEGFKDGNLHVREVRDKNQQVVAMVLLIEWRERLYNLISCITQTGRTLEANYWMYDQIIREFAGTDRWLDLEGSDVSGIANFYRKLGPVEEPYPFLRINKLPAIVKVLKN